MWYRTSEQKGKGENSGEKADRHTHIHKLSGEACQRSNAPCLVSSKLTR